MTIKNEDIIALEPSFAERYYEAITGAEVESSANEAVTFAAAGTGSEEILCISDNTATIQIAGVLSETGPNLIEQMLGFRGTSYKAIGAALDRVAMDSSVSFVKLNMDTPGGEVQGAVRIAQRVSELAKNKTVVAVNNGLLASAGYWIASAASEIVAISPTAETGSIGVIAIMRDRKDASIVRIVSSSAPRKWADVATAEGKAIIQERIDAVERVFLQAVADGRGISVEKVKKKFGRGGVFIAQDPDESKPDAIKIGMIDRVLYSSAIVAGCGDRKRSEISAETGHENQEETNTMEDQIKKLEATIAELTAENDALKKRISAATPFVSSDAYPDQIRKLAAAVLDGEQDAAALVGAVTVFDALQARELEGKTVAASEEHQEVAPEPTSATSNDGTIQTADDFFAMIHADKLAAGEGV